jgi:hypothetical protein
MGIRGLLVVITIVVGIGLLLERPSSWSEHKMKCGNFGNREKLDGSNCSIN